MRALIASFLLFTTTLSLAQGLQSPGRELLQSGSEPRFLPVDEAYQLAVAIEDEGLKLYWQIADEYYLYQHRFAFTLSDNGEDIAVEAQLPEALERTDEYFGQVRVYYHSADVRLRLARQPEQATLSVTFQGCADAGLCYPPEKKFFEIDFMSGSIAARDGPNTRASATASTESYGGTGGQALWYMLLLAFLGGSILNLMPCVFPILSLKVLAFTRSKDHARHLHGWVYSAGVVLSFLLIAALLIALQQAGRAIGWGFQLQSPGFVIALAYLFVAMGLSLSGLVHFGGNVMNVGSGLADRRGLQGSFFTGVLAVMVASPCTAPFMGTALGFAMTQPAPVALAVFAALGAGMASPLLLFSYSRAARTLMPQPGAWMDSLKQFLAFPLYGTAIWLLWVAGRQTGVNTMATALGGALVLVLGLWLWQRGGWKRGLAVLCMLGAVSLAMQRPPELVSSRTSVEEQGKVAWSEQKLDSLRRQGTPVFVDVTADWCLTCLANEAAVLFTDEMTSAFASHGVVYMVADWTNYDPDIAGFLARFGRTGIPLYLMYPSDPRQEPLVLPQILSKSTVLEALDKVSAKKSNLVINITEDRGILH
jgi:thiol:disulfide interchange protein DsbD